MKVVFFITGLLLLTCKHKEGLISPTLENITESVYASGKVKSKDQYEVFSTVPGIIQQIHVKEGDQVHAGDPIVSLINETPRLTAENARIAADYASVQSNRERLQESAEAISLAKTKLQNDSLLLGRQQNLWAHAIGTRNELEQRELALRNSLTAYQSAILRDRTLRKQLDLSARQTGKALEINNTLSRDYTIRARQDGRVYSIAKEKGELVSTLAPVAVIGAGRAFILELQVDEYDISKIQLGQEMAVTLDSYRGQVFNARVTKITPIMNERTRSFTIEAEFMDQPPHLFPNITAEANIIISKKEKALTIPRAYLQEDTSVLLANGERRQVTVGLKDYQQVEITGGLKQTEKIKKPE